MKILSSPFSFKGDGYLGKIYRPYIQILISSDKIDEWIPTEMIVDTGADYTLFPKRYAGFLGINLNKECKMEKTQGVGGQEKIYLCKKGVFIKIGEFKQEIPVGFLNRDNIPSLLGRLQALEVLTLTMKDKTTKFEI
ncbi:aspartyl protease family protein [Candidatus Daviesbacteria bacterium]|nr:aspartyl protease family protein [Candidatus Daviesbacteria bacterium]